MPDISMCQNEDCPVRYGCYRYTALPDEHWQSYAQFELKKDTITGEYTCDDFIAVFTEDVKKETPLKEKNTVIDIHRKTNVINNMSEYYNIIANKEITTTL